MPRVQPKDRFLKTNGVTHLMRKDMVMWVSLCFEEARYPRSFEWSHRGPMTCMECIAAPEGGVDVDVANYGHDWVMGPVTTTVIPAPTRPWRDEFSPVGSAAWLARMRARRSFGMLRNTINSALFFDGKEPPMNDDDRNRFSRSIEQGLHKMRGVG